MNFLCHAQDNLSNRSLVIVCSPLEDHGFYYSEGFGTLLAFVSILR